MPRVKQSRTYLREEAKQQASWIAEWLTPPVIVTCITWIVLASGFYYSTNMQIEQIKEQEKKQEAAIANEAANREKVRTEFLSITQKTQDALGTLNASVQVQSAKYDNLLTGLNKLGEAIDRQSTSAVRR